MGFTIVTGAAGHLGANLVRALLSQGRQVHALVRSDCRALEGLDVRCVQGDICDLDSLYRAFQGAEVVYHSAAYISLIWDDWQKLYSINVQGVKNVVEACRECGVRRLVHFSTVHALEQEPLDKPVDENRPLVDSRHLPPYDLSKAAGERIVRKAADEGLDAVILYPTGIIGPYDFKPSHFGEVLISLARGKFLAMVDAGFDWVDARDVADGALRAETQAVRGARYLLSGHWISMRELAQIVQSITHAPAPRLYFPVSIARLGLPFAGLFRSNNSRPLFTSVSLHALQGNRNISHLRATQDLGYQARPLFETIRDTLEWYQTVGYV